MTVDDEVERPAGVADLHPAIGNGVEQLYPDDDHREAIASDRMLLEEVLSLELPVAVRRDVVILRFVLTFETGWKTLRQALLEEQIRARYPKQAIAGAFRAGWLSQEDVWPGMLADRNLVARVQRDDAERILGHMPRNLSAFAEQRDLLRRRAR